jgi:transcription termination factor NusA
MSVPFDSAIALFVAELRVTREVATKLASVGHDSLEEIAYVPFNELLATGLDREYLNGLRQLARERLGTA